MGQVVSQRRGGSLQTFTPAPEGLSHQQEEGPCHEFQQEKEDTPTSSPAAGGNRRQLGGVTSQGSGKVHFLAVPCLFAATGRCEKYLSIFGQSLCCLLEASHQVFLVLLTNRTATATEREHTPEGIPDPRCTLPLTHSVELLWCGVWVYRSSMLSLLAIMPQLMLLCLE